MRVFKPLQHRGSGTEHHGCQEPLQWNQGPDLRFCSQEPRRV